MIEVSKMCGMRVRTVFKSMLHPYRGREWWPVDDDSKQASYLLGYEPPRYPVPALRGWNINPPHGGGVKNDCVRIGAAYVDWSRGIIEVY